MPLVPLSDEEAEALIHVADTDGDGRIDFKGDQCTYMISPLKGALHCIALIEQKITFP